MRDSTAVVATIFRLVSIGFWSWAAMHSIAWLLQPLVTQIDPWGTVAFDPRRLVTIIGCVVAGVALYAISLPLAVRITATPESAKAFVFAFSSIRVIAFFSVLFASVWIALAVFELCVRNATETLPGQVHVNAAWLIRRALMDSIPFLLFGLLWPCAGRLARLITRFMSSTPVK